MWCGVISTPHYRPPLHLLLLLLLILKVFILKRKHASTENKLPEISAGN